jgi:hypothetical protein
MLILNLNVKILKYYVLNVICATSPSDGAFGDFLFADCYGPLIIDRCDAVYVLCHHPLVGSGRDFLL